MKYFDQEGDLIREANDDRSTAEIYRGNGLWESKSRVEHLSTPINDAEAQKLIQRLDLRCSELSAIKLVTGLGCSKGEICSSLLAAQRIWPTQGSPMRGSAPTKPIIPKI